MSVSVPTSLDFLHNAKWHNEPPDWSLNDKMLSLITGMETDFWQDTFYGFHRDDGHFLGAPVSGDFTTIVTFQGHYKVLYDQAGLMLRADRNNWLKAGIEFSDDVTNFSVVVTRNGHSDWSVIAVPYIIGPQKIRLTRFGTALLVHYHGQDGAWYLMRVTYFPDDRFNQIGPMACSPKREGFEVQFTSFEVGPPIASPLHTG